MNELPVHGEYLRDAIRFKFANHHISHTTNNYVCHRKQVVPPIYSNPHYRNVARIATR